MYKLGILGYPLGHSISPIMQEAALKSMNLEGSYKKLETPPEKLAQVVKLLSCKNFSGVNVTIPHKVNVIQYLDVIDDAARIIGAVNTIKFENNKLYGFNTDVYGFVLAIDSNSIDWLKNKHVAVLGAGGAARAVIVGLDSIGVSCIKVYARDIQKAELFIDSLKDNVKAELRAIELNKSIKLDDISMVVNTTPLGMQGDKEGLSPLSEDTMLSLSTDAIIYDIVYKPRMTKLLLDAQKRGLRIIEGIDMLILQGAKSFEIWTGQKAPVDVMRKAAIESI